MTQEKHKHKKWWRSLDTLKGGKIATFLRPSTLLHETQPVRGAEQKVCVGLYLAKDWVGVPILAKLCLDNGDVMTYTGIITKVDGAGSEPMVRWDA